MGPGAARAARIDVDGLAIHYWEQGTGRPLVLLHGGLATAEMSWGRAMPLLAPHYRVLAPDSRGHGRTGNPEQVLSYARMADDVAGFCKALGLDRPMVLGYSDGAQIAIELGLRHPHLASALVIGGAISQMTPSYVAGLHDWGFLAPGQYDLARVEAAFGGFLEAIKTEHAHVHGPHYWQAMLGQIATLWLSVPSYGETELARIAVPSLIIAGDRDEMAGLDEASRLYRSLPRAELSVIPNADHGAIALPMFWDVVRDFLSRHADRQDA